MKKIIYVTFIGIAIIFAIYYTVSAYGTDYYMVNAEEIENVVVDDMPNQIIVTAGSALFIMNADNGSIIDTFQPNIWMWLAIPSEPTDGKIYGVGENNDIAVVQDLVFSLERGSHVINQFTLTEGYHANYILQDDPNLYIIGSNKTPGTPKEDWGKIFVVRKSDMAEIAEWPCEEWPSMGIMKDNLIYIPCGQIGWHDIGGDGGFNWEEDQAVMNIGCYDTLRNGQEVGLYETHAYIAGLGTVADGTIIVGHENYPEYNQPIITVLTDPLEEIYIPQIAMRSMDIDKQTNRVFGPLLDQYGGSEESTGYVLIWDYDTRDYEIINTGIEGLRYVTYCNGFLFGWAARDNKLYKIPVGS
jgi:hypothetical protein